MSEILETRWYTGLATIGIVKTKDQVTGEIKFRIGKALDRGGTEEEDARYIANHGLQVNPASLIEFLNSK